VWAAKNLGTQSKVRLLAPAPKKESKKGLQKIGNGRYTPFRKVVARRLRGGSIKPGESHPQKKTLKNNKPPGKKNTNSTTRNKKTNTNPNYQTKKRGASKLPSSGDQTLLGR